MNTQVRTNMSCILLYLLDTADDRVGLGHGARKCFRIAFNADRMSFALVFDGAIVEADEHAR